MQIAIHPVPRGFSDKWIEYCDQHNVPYKLVDCYASDIIEQMQDCDGLMWQWSTNDHKAKLSGRQIVYSLEIMGKKVFPDSKTCWHYDDKVGQKYLLEAIGAPFVPTYVFYDKDEALAWAKATSYPKVFKLSGGAGSANVKLAPNQSSAIRLIRKAFGQGFKPKSRLHLFKDRLWHFRRDKDLKSFLNISKGVGRLVIPTQAEKNLPVERNYIYFQDFVPDNDHDIRIVVIGKRAFALKRLIREDDFRASGSGNIIYEPAQIPKKCVELAFQMSNTLCSQSLAYDFVFYDGIPYVIEISYAFAPKAYLPCPGYWDESLQWVEGHFYSEFFMIEDLIHQINADPE